MPSKRIELIQAVTHVRDTVTGLIKPRLSGSEAGEGKEHATDCFKQLLDTINQTLDDK